MNCSRRLNSCLRHLDLLPRVSGCNTVCVNTYCEKKSPNKDGNRKEKKRMEKDPFLLFMSEPVQALLKSIQGRNPAKAFRGFKAEYATKPRYKLLTDEELGHETSQILHSRGWMKLQMPPFMAERKPRDEVISDDSDIAEAVTIKHVFVDISERSKRIMGRTDRPIVCRHPDGKLRHADWETTDRMRQMFDPVPGRELVMPKMFHEDVLEELLKQDQVEYRYILERACVQFEPDSEHFIRITRRVYEEVAKNKRYEDLYSTRFYGPMVFYFCWVKHICPLLTYLLETERILGAAKLVRLYKLVNEDFKLSGYTNAAIIIRQFVQHAKDNSLEDYETLEAVFYQTDFKKLNTGLPNKLKGTGAVEMS